MPLPDLVAGVRTRHVVTTAGDPMITAASMNWRDDQSKRGVVLIHGHNANELQAVDPVWGKAMQALVRAGYPTVAPLAGNIKPCGNDLSITRTGQAVTWAQTDPTSDPSSPGLGAKTDKVFVAGVSAGFLTACNWARQNTSIVAGILGFVFAPGLARLHDAVGFVGDPLDVDVDAAYTNHSGYLAGLSTHDPAAYGATDLAGIPMLLVRSTDDNAYNNIVSQQANFVSVMQAASPGKVTEVTMTGGHALTNLDYAAVKTFLDANA